MTPFRTGILEPTDFSPEAIAKLKTLGPVSLFRSGRLKTFLGDKQSLFVRLGHMIDGTLLDMAPALRVIVSPTTGHNHLDLAALDSRAITLLSLKGEKRFLSTVRATPEHAVGLIFALLRNYRTAFLNSRNAAWDRDRHVGSEIAARTVGIVGFGRVGRSVAKILAAAGARIVFFDSDPDVPARHGAERLGSADQVAQASDVLVIAASHQPGTRPIIGRGVLNRMKGGYLINVARGELVDEAALISLVARGWFSGVALDVIADELAPGNRLGTLVKLADKHNLLLTPHIGGATADSMRKTEDFMAEKLIRFVARRRRAGSAGG